MKRKSIIVGLLLCLLLILGGCVEIEIIDTIDEINDNLRVHFIDVGQGDSTLVELPNGEKALIDGGTKSSSESLVSYIKSLGIKKIDHVIGTHPHEDHIGGLPDVLKNFEVANVYLPGKTNNTKIYEDLLNTIKDKNLKINLGKTGTKIVDTVALKFYFIAPSKEYNDINNNSIVSKIIYKDVSLIVTGDSEKEAENDMLDEGHNLKADILKIAHHGSSTSNTEDFINKVNPTYSIISLGKDNIYGFPHKETMITLEGIDTKILRTDELGTIVLETDGKGIEVLNNVEFIDENNDSKENIYIGNKNSKIYHDPSCGSLPNEENQVIFNSEEEAIKEGYKPHSTCVK